MLGSATCRVQRSSTADLPARPIRPRSWNRRSRRSPPRSPRPSSRSSSRSARCSSCSSSSSNCVSRWQPPDPSFHLHAVDNRSQSPRLPAVSRQQLQATVPLEERYKPSRPPSKVHDQTKVESTSRYPVRVTGLILFNGFVNKGVPDNTDLPASHCAATTTSGNGSLGASLRQTILGVEGDGPRIGGARTSANVSLDFFSGVAYTSYGTSAGVVRMRTAAIDFDWAERFAAGRHRPAPDLATLARLLRHRRRAFAGGRRQPLDLGAATALHPSVPAAERPAQFEFGLWDPAAAGYNSESALPRREPRRTWPSSPLTRRASPTRAPDDVASSSASADTTAVRHIPDIKAMSAPNISTPGPAPSDLRVPLGHHLEISGEGYRGRAIGGLGGGVYKDVIAGTSPATGATPCCTRLNAIGGWTQFKTRFNSSLETNFSIGLDDGFASDFHAVVHAADCRPHTVASPKQDVRRQPDLSGRRPISSCRRSIAGSGVGQSPDRQTL